MLKVLIVEDEDVIRKGLELTIDWLSMACSVVATAKDGEEGLQKIREHRPDLVLADIHMPKLDGLSMVEQAQDFHMFYTIFITSFSEFEYAKKAIDLQCIQYLLKPLDERELQKSIEKVQDLLAQEQQFKELANMNKNKFVDNIKNLQVQHGNRYVNQCIDIICEQYHTKLSVVDVAEKLEVSTSYLSRKLKEELNVGFLELLSMYRLSQSIKLLSEGNYKIYEVSDLCGFTDYKHYCHVFKKYFGQSPRAYLSGERVKE